MNYSHAFHAGSFADVFKHVVLVGIINSLLKKEKSFCYLDTHAGAGMYDLLSKEAQKTKEAENGILELLKNKKPPALVKTYLQIIRSFNNAERLQFYPGSPRIVRYFLREEDKIILTELQKEAFQALKLEFKDDKQVGVHHLDGYQALKAFLPLKPRGLVLIDPPYEASNEYQQLIENISFALKRWQEGIYAIWYPIKNPYQIKQFHEALLRKTNAPILVTEFNIFPQDSPLSLNGSGMVIINPPWQLKETLQENLPFLYRALAQDQGSYRIDQIK